MTKFIDDSKPSLPHHRFLSTFPFFSPTLRLLTITTTRKDECESLSVPSSLRPHGLGLARLLCPWNSSGKNTGVGCHFLLQKIFPTQGSNQDL